MMNADRFFLSHMNLSSQDAVMDSDSIIAELAQKGV